MRRDGELRGSIMNELIPIDLAHLQKITRGDADFQQELLETFMEDAPDFIEEIKIALVTQDHHTLKHKAHQLKGAAATVGIFPLSNLAEQLEKKVQQEQLDFLSYLVEKMEILLEQVRVFLETGGE